MTDQFSLSSPNSVDTQQYSFPPALFAPSYYLVQMSIQVSSSPWSCQDLGFGYASHLKITIIKYFVSFDIYDLGDSIIILLNCMGEKSRAICISEECNFQ